MDSFTENISQETNKWKCALKWILRVLWSLLTWIGVFCLCTKYLEIYDLWKILLISSCITIAFITLIIFITRKLLKNIKSKKIIKWIFKVLWYMLWFFLLRFLFILLVSYICRILPGKTNIYLLMILWTIIYILLILFVILLVKWLKSKNKNIIKWFIVNIVIIMVVIWWWLTKAWIIPNFLNLEILCPNDCWYLRCSAAEKAIYTEQFWCVCARDPSTGLMKPIIYLYPTEETKIKVTLWTPENLSHTYPKYNSEKWRNIVAKPNGDLEDMDTWRKLYALYREWKTYAEDNFEEWFVVKWEDIIPFLEEKLSILWLNEREAEEFIVYWLPQMENNKYNVIRFETKEEQDENMPLNITPTPDTVIRVMMDWKAIDESIEISEQKLKTPERRWFTVVEWWWSPRN